MANMSATVAIIDCGSGNLRSVAKAFERMGAEQNARILITADAADLTAATHIVLPGVGAFADCMRGLTALPGMHSALEHEVRERKKPFLGICVGMQMLLDRSFEHGDHKGLGWIAGDIVKIESGVRSSEFSKTDDGQPPTTNSQGTKHKAQGTLKIPHMGWNDLVLRAPNHPLLAGINSGDHAYFVHSYHARPADPAVILAEVDYGGPIAAILGRGNIMGTQFHPEKSQATGLRLLANFLRWTPTR